MRRDIGKLAQLAPQSSDSLSACLYQRGKVLETGFPVSATNQQQGNLIDYRRHRLA
jgi:hypothetical protein